MDYIWLYGLSTLSSGGWTLPLRKKNILVKSVGLGWLFPIEWKKKVMFQTTDQIKVVNASFVSNQTMHLQRFVSYNMHTRKTTNKIRWDSLDVGNLKSRPYVQQHASFLSGTQEATRSLTTKIQISPMKIQIFGRKRWGDRLWQQSQQTEKTRKLKHVSLGSIPTWNRGLGTVEDTTLETFNEHSKSIHCRVDPLETVWNKDNVTLWQLNIAIEHHHWNSEFSHW